MAQFLWGIINWLFIIVSFNSFYIQNFSFYWCYKHFLQSFVTSSFVTIFTAIPWIFNVSHIFSQSTTPLVNHIFLRLVARPHFGYLSVPFSNLSGKLHVTALGKDNNASTQSQTQSSLFSLSRRNGGTLMKRKEKKRLEMRKYLKKCFLSNPRKRGHRQPCQRVAAVSS